MAQKIDPKAQQSAAANRIYEDFQPPFDWAREQASDTLIVSLEGFRKEQLRVQITSSRLLRVSGERQLDDKRWRRFSLELNVPQDSDTNEIAARFERGTLYIKFPKLITPSNSKPQSVPPTPPPSPSEKPPQQEAAPAKPTGGVEEEKAEEEEAMKKKAETTTSKMTEEQLTGKGSDVDDGDGDDDERKASAAKKNGQSENYRDGIVGLIGEVKKQKKIANLVMAILMVLLIVLYVKNSIKSSLGGSNTQDL